MNTGFTTQDQRSFGPPVITSSPTDQRSFGPPVITSSPPVITSSPLIINWHIKIAKDMIDDLIDEIDMLQYRLDNYTIERHLLSEYNIITQVKYFVSNGITVDYRLRLLNKLIDFNTNLIYIKRVSLSRSYMLFIPYGIPVLR